MKKLTGKLGEYQEDIPALSSLPIERYERIFKALKAELFYQKMVVTENENFKKIMDLRANIIDELEQARLLYNSTVLNVV